MRKISWIFGESKVNEQTWQHEVLENNFYHFNENGGH